MSTQSDHERDPMDELLRASTPPSFIVDEAMSKELEEMVVRSAKFAPPQRRRAWARPAAIGLAAVLVLGGAATAAAATGVWSPWAQTPDAVVSYQLPSGAMCENRLGFVTGADPAATEVVRSFLRATDMSVLISSHIEATIKEMRSEKNTFFADDGTEEPAGYGTNHYSADTEYDHAVSRIVSNALREPLAEAHINLDTANLEYLGESNCPGAKW